MALMLRETAHEQNESQPSYRNTGPEQALQTFGASQAGRTGTASSLLPAKNVQGVMPQGAGIMPDLVAQKNEIDELNMNPQELGQLIVNLQDEIKVIKLQLENLPGYETGEVPAHLTKLKMELEKTFESLEKKNEILISSMAMNFGSTQQDLPNFKLPEIITARGAVGKKSLMGMQTDILGMDQLYGAAIDKSKLMVPKGANILQKPLIKATKSY